LAPAPPVNAKLSTAEPLARALARVVQLRRRVTEEIEIDLRLRAGAELHYLLARLGGVEHRTRQ
jgi:hypothetical protein